MTVKTTPIGQRYTTRHLTIPLAYRPTARAIAAGVVAVIVLAAFVLDALQRPAAAALQEAQPLVMHQVVYIVATPTPHPPPTAAPAVMVAPATAAPQIEPTVEPTIEAPLSVEVSSAPQAAPVCWAGPPAPYVEGAEPCWRGVPFVQP